MSNVVLTRVLAKYGEDLKQKIGDYKEGKDCNRKLKERTQEAIEKRKTKER